MTNYARIEERKCFMSQQFAVEYAKRLFGEEAVNKLPKLSKGKRKGLFKGELSWRRCVSGGWHKDSGGVIYPGLIYAEIRIDDAIFASKNSAGDMTLP